MRLILVRVRQEKPIISKPEPVILCGGFLRLWETPAKVGL
jgi:hypothetical protein